MRSIAFVTAQAELKSGDLVERERDASACMRRHQAFALAPVKSGDLAEGPAGHAALPAAAAQDQGLRLVKFLSSR